MAKMMADQLFNEAVVRDEMSKYAKYTMRFCGGKKLLAANLHRRGTGRTPELLQSKSTGSANTSMTVHI